MAKREDVIRKIKGLMKIAEDPSASREEVLQASMLAQKQMIKYKIEQHEIENQKEEQYLENYLLGKMYGYYAYIFKVVADNFRCDIVITGKANSNNCLINLIGLKEDLEFAKPMIEALKVYLDRKLKDLKDVCIDDFKSAKKDYVFGFSRGLETAFKKSLLEMDLTKNELVLMEKPVILKNYLKENTKRKRTKARTGSTSFYEKGIKDGQKYKVR